MRHRTVSLLSVVALLAGLGAAVAPAATADHTPDPASVAIAGDLQSELGCPGDWQPDCADTDLAYDAEDDVWQGTFNVPAADDVTLLAGNSIVLENGFFVGAGATFVAVVDPRITCP